MVEPESHAPREEDPAATRPRRARLEPIFGLLVRVVPFIVLYWVLMRVLREVAHLPEASYEQPIIAVGLIAQLVQSPLFLALFTLIVVLRRRALWQAWRAFDHGGALRWLMVLVVAVCAWQWSAYAYNFYFDQAHYMDRALLIALGIAVWWRPIFVLPFLLLCYAIAWQFDYPLLGLYQYHLEEVFSLPLNILPLFIALVLLPRSLRGREEVFFFLLLCVVASSYWTAGLTKARTGWLLVNDLEYMLPGAYTNGWLVSLEPDQIVRMTGVLALFSGPLKVFTLLVECGSLLVLLRRSVTRVWLAGCLAFHTGILLVSGIFFWQWIVIDAGLLVFLLTRRGRSLEIYSGAHFALSLVLIASSAIWFHPPTRLFWHDTPVSYTYRFAGIDRDGAEHLLSAQGFAPYDYVVGLGDFQYLNPGSQLSFSWGLTYDAEIAADLAGVRTPEEVFALERKHQAVYFDPLQSARMDRFLTRFVGHRNRRGGRTIWWGALGPPPMAFMSSQAESPPVSTPIARVVVTLNTWLYDGEGLTRIRREKVREIDIPVPPE